MRRVRFYYSQLGRRWDEWFEYPSEVTDDEIEADYMAWLEDHWLTEPT